MYGVCPFFQGFNAELLKDQDGTCFLERYGDGSEGRSDPTPVARCMSTIPLPAAFIHRITGYLNRGSAMPSKMFQGL